MPSDKGVSAALVNALLAAGLAGSNAIDGLRSPPGGEKTNRTARRIGFGLHNVMPPSREVSSWALRQLSDLASDRDSQSRRR
jgi:hypothetical protein